ncbi:MAG TPA: outer membrane beta-barrel protein [Rhodopila sp.]|jgi:hypothetical protein|nr:outer membrane beta-barrel protein [Rhodopila sp.]
MITNKYWLHSPLVAAATIALGSATAAAQTPPQPPPPAATTTAPAADAPPPGLWIDGIHLSAQLEGGISFNPAGPKDNFGQLFTDHPNQPLLNQILLTANKPLDPKATGFDWGFKLQGMYGSDARYTQFLGELNRVDPGARNQLDIVEANVLFHLPVLVAGGVDLKAGQYVTPLGYETIDPSTNPFYSHSYIFNFGIPLKQTGVLAVGHVSPLLDVYLSVDTGVNTSFGPLGDNNSAVAFLGGVNLTLLGGNLTILALTHIGPENATRLLDTLPPAGFNADGYYRYLNDIVVTYKASDKLTLVTEANLIRDDFAGYYSSATHTPSAANAFGAAQYASYALNDTITLNGRAEVYRDDNNFFVASFPGNNDFVAAEQGFTFGVGAPHPTTYSEITLGVTYKPANLPTPINGLLIRPEVRYDRALTNTHPYNSGKDDGSFTIASDVVLTF